jgi:outer membrane protein assembly factor BamB
MPLEQVWLTALDASPAAQGVMDDERFYLPLDSAIVALDRRTGTAAWTSRIVTGWPPILAGKSLFAATAQGIHDVDPATGLTRRVLAMSSSPAGPMTLAGDLLLVPTEDDGLHALRVSDGGLAWRQALGAASRGRAALGPKGLAFIALADARVAAVSLADGRVRWTTALAGSLTEPAVSRDRVFAGSTRKAVFALDASSGDLEWTWSTGGDVVGLAADENSVYVVSLDNMIRAFNRGSGNLRWKQPLETRPTHQPRLVDGRIIVSGVQPALMVFDRVSGGPLSSYELEAPLEDEVLDAAPVIAGGDDSPHATAVLVLRSGHLVGLRLKSADAPVSAQ